MSGRVRYSGPMTLDDTFVVIDGIGSGGALIAGGQELMPALNRGEFEPTVLVDLAALDELQGIEIVDGRLSIGALTTHRMMLASAEVLENAPLLAEAVAKIGGGWQVRNRGTIGGNIVSMHALYDVLPPLLALGAELEIRDRSKTYIAPLADIMAGTSHGLGSSAILIRVLLPAGQGWTGWAYHKLKATAGDYGFANAAVLLRTGNGRRIEDIRLIIGAVEALPRDLSGIAQEAVLSGDPARASARLREVVPKALRAPLDDQKGGAAYRAAMAGVAAARAFDEALARIQREDA